MSRALYVLRHLLALLLLPGTMVVFIPVWIVRRYDVHPSWPTTALAVALATAGSLVGLVGLSLFWLSVRHFFTHGRGTLGPWDPPRRLVVQGPYRYVRNPMISGVILMQFATALMLRSLPHTKWAGLFLILNAIFIPLLEEPQLRQRFGDEYARYCRNVPRLLPRLRPWNAEDA